MTIPKPLAIEKTHIDRIIDEDLRLTRLVYSYTAYAAVGLFSEPSWESTSGSGLLSRTSGPSLAVLRTIALDSYERDRRHILATLVPLK